MFPIRNLQVSTSNSHHISIHFFSPDHKLRDTRSRKLSLPVTETISLDSVEKIRIIIEPVPSVSKINV